MGAPDPFHSRFTGNLGAFAKQKFRCTKCNMNYRRMPQSGKSHCEGNVIPTVNEGSVKKYLNMSKEICTNYNITEYTWQRVEVIDMNIESPLVKRLLNCPVLWILCNSDSVWKYNFFTIETLVK